MTAITGIGALTSIDVGKVKSEPARSTVTVRQPCCQFSRGEIFEQCASRSFSRGFLSFDKCAQDGIDPRLIAAPAAKPGENIRATAINYLEARFLLTAGLACTREMGRGRGKGNPADFK
jgi:hypothetical protein